MAVLIRLEKFYRLLNILSIDVVLGAMCSAAWFASIFGVDLKPQALITLGLTVWIIYTADHLLDAKKTIGSASTSRHRFHQEHFTLLLIALLIATAVDLFFVLSIRKAVFEWGLILAIIMVAYFLFQRYLKFLKEITIAILFSCGVLLPSLALSQKFPGVDVVLIIVEFALTALLNLLLFSWFDRQHDIRDKRESFVTLMGEKKSKWILDFVFLLNVALMGGTLFYKPEMTLSVVILFLMNAILAFMFVRPQQFQHHDRFRLVGDGVFLLPLLYLLL